MKTVFVDVDTQLDFLYPAGALAVLQGAALAGGLTQLTRFAAEHRITLLSTTDAHPENDPEFEHWPPHCIAGTLGQRKSQFTTLSKSTILPNAEVAVETLKTAAEANQIIIEKQDIDCFTNVNLRPLLNEWQAERYVVYGVVAEVCVEKALFGLLQQGGRVECVTDGIGPISEPRMRNMLAHFQAAGGKLTTVGQATA